MTPHEYYSMTRAEFILKLKGFQNKQAKKAWHTREIVYATYATQPGRKKAMPPKHKFWPLPMDHKGLERSAEEMRAKWNTFKK